MKKHTIYFDNAAASKLNYKVEKYINKYKKYFHNIQSHTSTLSKKLRNKNKKWKNIISRILNCNKNKINWITNTYEISNYISQILIKKFSNINIITTSKIHKSTLNILKTIYYNNISITYIKSNKNKTRFISNLKQKIKTKTLAIYTQYINSENGEIIPYKNLNKLCIKNNILTYIDFTQAIGIKNINIKTIKPNIASFTVYKIHGPKGITCIFTNKIKPINIKNKNHTLPIEQFAGLVKTLQITYKNIEKNKIKFEINKNTIINTTLKIKYLKIKPKKNLDSIIEIKLKLIPNFVIKKFLKNMIISYGYSCETNINNISNKNSLRISFSKFTKKPQINLLIKNINIIYSKLM